MSKVIHFTFRGDEVSMTVTGVQGPTCTNVTSALNRALGSRVARTEFTDEFYQEPGAAQQQASQGDQIQEG